MSFGDKKAASVALPATTYLRRAQVAEKFNVSVRTVERWAFGDGGPPFAMMGRVSLYPESELEAWARSRLRKSTVSPSRLAVDKAA